MSDNHLSLNSLNQKDLAQRYKDAVFFPWSKQREMEPLLVKEARGSFLELWSGQKLLDMKSRSFSANLGHSHQGMQEALAEAAKRTEVLSLETYCPERLKLAEKLKAIAPKNADAGFGKVFFTLGGAEANENAIKMARLYTKRHKIITRFRSYHGASLATINLSGDYRRIAVDGGVSGIIRFPDPYPRGSGQEIDTVKLLSEIIEIEGPETIAAIMLEGVTGANGVFLPPPDYWARIRKLCDEHGIVLIADEVFSGFFRTGRWFGIDHYNVVPDMITMSKGLTAGYAPLGAVLASNKISTHFDHETLWCGLTQYGNPLCCAAANAAIGFYESEGIADNVEGRGRELKDGLFKLAVKHPNIAEVRSIGLLAAVDLRKSAFNDEPLVPYRAGPEDMAPVAKLQKALLQEGLSIQVRFSTIIIAPPLNISDLDLAFGLDALDRALAVLKS
jgi:taurine--2-oxoglutarate transaminase